MAWHAGTQLVRASAQQVAQQLDHPHRVFGTRVTQPVKRRRGRAAGGRRGAERARGQGRDVWHCSLSLSAEEGVLEDGRWAQISEQFVARMGFADPQAGGSPCRWAAVRHGLSRAVTITCTSSSRRCARTALRPRRGTTARVHRRSPASWRQSTACRCSNRARRAAARGASSLPSARSPRVATPSARPPTKQPVRRRRRASPWRGRSAGAPRRRRTRRSSSGAWCAPARGSGRALRRTTDVVVGYSVALRAPEGARADWYGDGRLARDLTLPRLRAQWPDTPQSASAAVREWNAATTPDARPYASGRETSRPGSELWHQSAREVMALAEQLRAVDVDDLGDVGTRRPRDGRRVCGMVAGHRSHAGPTGRDRRCAGALGAAARAASARPARATTLGARRRASPRVDRARSRRAHARPRAPAAA